MRFTIVIAVALICIVLGIAVLKLSTPSEVHAPQATGQAQDVSTQDVLVAKADIPVGTTLTADLVDRQPWPKNLVLKGFITGESKSIVGMVTRSDVRSREPFDLSKLAKPLEGGYIASFLPKGMRAITLQVNSISGVAGYMFPGDRVDVLLTHSIPQKIPGDLWGERNNESGQTPTTSETLLTNVKILAINDRKEEQPTDQGQVRVATRNDRLATPTNVTIAVLPTDAEKLRLSEKNGTLSLALRSTQENAAANEEPGTPVTLLDLSRIPTVTPAEGVVVVRGIKETTTPMPGYMQTMGTPMMQSQPIPEDAGAPEAGR